MHIPLLIMKISGIYQIQSKVKPERIYIGSSINLGKRWHIHLYHLRDNKHGSIKLQRYFNKYGESDLQFSILLGREKEDLIKIEQYFMDSYNPYFNVCKIAYSKLGVKHTKETCEKMSKSGKVKIFSESHRRNLSKSSKLRIRQPMSEETKQKIREKRKLMPRRIISEKDRQNMREGWKLRQIRLKSA